VSDRLLVATRKGLFTLMRGSAAGWAISQADFLGDHCSSVLADRRDGSLYAALYHGHFGVKLHRSRDTGASWEEIPAPRYPPKDDAEPEWIDPHGRVVPQSLELIWCLEAGGAETPGRLWCGTVPGGLFRSDDAGDSWHLVESLWNDPARKGWFGGGMDYPGIHSVCVSARKPGELTVAVSCGGIWRSDDDGTSWRCIGEGLRADYFPPDQARNPAIQDVHRLVQSPSHPHVFWVQHHNGIFRSGDGALTFEELEGIEPSSFGFAVAVHPSDPDTAWFVPQIKDERRIPVDGRILVLRTRDGGRSFAPLRGGLPQEHAYDIFFRHGLDVDDSGATLAMGSTTGSLWSSADAGESWSCAAAHLPPIYAVRFAP